MPAVPRVNGAMLAGHQGKLVTLVGKITSVSGSTLTLEASVSPQARGHPLRPLVRLGGRQTLRGAFGAASVIGQVAFALPTPSSLAAAGQRERDGTPAVRLGAGLRGAAHRLCGDHRDGVGGRLGSRAACGVFAHEWHPVRPSHIQRSRVPGRQQVCPSVPRLSVSGCCMKAACVSSWRLGRVARGVLQQRPLRRMGKDRAPLTRPADTVCPSDAPRSGIRIKRCGQLKRGRRRR